MIYSSNNLALHRVNKYRMMSSRTSKVPNGNFREGAKALVSGRLGAISPEIASYYRTRLGEANVTEGATATKDFWGFLTSTIEKAGDVITGKEERRMVEARARIDAMRTSYGTGGKGFATDPSTILLIGGSGLLLTMLMLKRKRGRRLI